jgi:hypothetical protein
MLRCAEYVTCSAVAAVLDLSEQQCRLLLDTLAAVGGSINAQGLEPMVNLHELSLFLLAQIYGREAHRCAAAQGVWCWGTNSTCAEDAVHSRRGSELHELGVTEH